MFNDLIPVAQPVVVLLLVLAICGISYWIYQHMVRRPLERMALALKAVLQGDLAAARRLFVHSELAPLVKNIDEAIQRQEETGSSVLSFPSPWNPGRLRSQVGQQFDGSRLCIVANREPCIHNQVGEKIVAQFPASGLVTAVEPIIRACSGLWIAHGSGTADKDTSDEQGRLGVPPTNPEYTLKRVWLSDDEEKGYYYGFSNEGLWPLCHIAHARPIFRREDWERYQSVNEKFADAFCEELSGGRTPVGLIQDYHFALLPRLIRRRMPEAVLSLFWHIPWPNPEVIGICPWKREILQGMLAADLIGFHTQYHCNNFLDTADRFLEVRVDRENFSVTERGHTCYVKPFPISVEWPPKHEVEPDRIPEIRREVLHELQLPENVLISVGVDRLDYTKGILEKFLAVEKLLEKHPDLVGRFVMIQISAPSRILIRRYQDLDSEIRDTVNRINEKFRRETYVPILHRVSHHDSQDVFRYYRAADVCVVSSLHDGMNLVAKEFVASRSDNGGALVLSSFTGAAREMTDAFITNPYDIEETAEAMHRALFLDGQEREKRMSRLRAGILRNNAYSWAGHFLEEIHRIAEERDVEWASSTMR